MTHSEIVYSPLGVKLALMNGTALTKAFVPLTGGATAVYTSSSGVAYYRHTDHLGSSRLASTSTQTVYSDTAYSPFGEPYASSGGIDNSFTSQNQDTLAGLYDFLYREYDPYQARWASPDPAGLAAVYPSNPQSWNRYSYVLNNPLSLIDPFGLECVWDDGSYDSSSDPMSGSSGQCAGLGGTWIDPSFFSDFGLSDWSGSANSDLAAVAYAIQSGFALVQTGSGLSGWMLVANGGAGPIDWSLLGSQVPTVTYSQQLLGAVAQGMKRAGGVIPTVCGGGVYFFGGRERSALGVHAFYGGIVEFDSRYGASGGALVEVGAGEGYVGGGGKVVTANRQGEVESSGLLYGGLGYNTPLASAQAGVAVFSSGAGPFGEVSAFGLAGGGGAYLSITSVSGCNQ
jgi:RHS repeat-associated protein